MCDAGETLLVAVPPSRRGSPVSAATVTDAKPFALLGACDHGGLCESCGRARAAVYVVFPPCDPKDAFAVCSNCADVAP